MAFQIKSFPSIVAGVINHMRGTQTAITDFSVGSVARTMVEAPSIEIEETYLQLFHGLREAIPVATYNSFSFARLEAQPAVGIVQVTIAPNTADVLIAAGTVFSTGGSIAYSSLADVLILAGATTGSVLVSATTPGVAGNAPAGSSFSAAPLPVGFISAQNTVAFVSGQDLETDDQRKQRFALYISTLQRGTVAALIYGAKTVALRDVNGIETERVRAASVVEPYLADPEQPIALVLVYVHNGAGSTSGELVARVAEVLHGYTESGGNKVAGWKAAGVQVTVAAATEVEIDVTAALTAAGGYDETALATLAEGVIGDYIRSLDIGAAFLEAEAVHRVMQIDGVMNITGLPADQAADADEKLMPGTIAVT